MGWSRINSRKQPQLWISEGFASWIFNPSVKVPMFCIKPRNTGLKKMKDLFCGMINIYHKLPLDFLKYKKSYPF